MPEQDQALVQRAQVQQALHPMLTSVLALAQLEAQAVLLACLVA